MKAINICHQLIPMLSQWQYFQFIPVLQCFHKIMLSAHTKRIYKGKLTMLYIQTELSAPKQVTATQTFLSMSKHKQVPIGKSTSQIYNLTEWKCKSKRNGNKASSLIISYQHELQYENG